jgi:pimeloyl-ACP methyl ester carboxylesterase
MLLHGLWMGRPALWPLAQHLRAAGFQPQLHGYPTILGDPARERRRLRERWCALGPEAHLVGHSLGGHLAIATLAEAVADPDGGPPLPPGRIVCLASPLAGSSVARRLGRGRWGGLLMGRAGPQLSETVAIPQNREVASIAGDHAIGLGRLFGQFDGPNDGTVSVAETRIPGLAAHATVASSHSGIMFNRQAAELTLQFLLRGAFTATAAAAGDSD